VRILYYALGGGHGHVLRGLAVLSRLGAGPAGRGAAVPGARGVGAPAAGATLLGPARLAHWAAALGVPYLTPPEPCPPAWFSALSPPDLLLVDVFPRGVVGELTPLLGRAPAWLVSRWVEPAYYLDPGVRAAIESCYERLVWTEAPPAPLRALDVPQVEVGPVLVHPGPLSRDEARRALDVPQGRRLLLGLGSGDAERQAALCRLLGKVAARLGVALRFVSAELPPSPPVVPVFPAARVLPAADVVVAAGGYHAFHETRLAGVPTVFVPQRRRHDDQWHRVRGAAVAADPLELECLVRAALVAPGASGARGAEPMSSALARLVERRVQAGVLRQEEVAAMA
jgi:hypothetical protein